MIKFIQKSNSYSIGASGISQSYFDLELEAIIDNSVSHGEITKISKEKTLFVMTEDELRALKKHGKKANPLMIEFEDYTQSE
jgi:hypothetical protein